VYQGRTPFIAGSRRRLACVLFSLAITLLPVGSSAYAPTGTAPATTSGADVCHYLRHSVSRNLRHAGTTQLRGRRFFLCGLRLGLRARLTVWAKSPWVIQSSPSWFTLQPAARSFVASS
jgi:hypothetical protein